MKVPNSKSQIPNPKLKAINFFFFLIPVYLYTSISLSAQQKNLPLSKEWGLNIEKFNSQFQGKDSLIAIKKNPFSCFKPYVESSSYSLEFVTKENLAPRTMYFYSEKAWIYRKSTNESLIIINDSIDRFHLTLDPLFNFEFGRDRADSSKSFYKNTRGVLVRGDIGTKFSFESSFYENQATFVKYIDDYIKSTNNLFPSAINYQYNVIPGQGRAKTFKKTGYDFAMASGYISYSPSSHFNFQVGTGKHFVGDGYRSLLLSDNAFNYPFARISSSFGKFQYTNLYTSFMNLTHGGVKTPPGTERLFQKKAGSFQFLSWNAHKRIQFGIFQGMIWKSTDSANKTYLNASYFDPLILVNSFEQGMNNENNVLLGSTLKLKITNSISLYGQYMLDDIAENLIRGSLHNKQGFQMGAKYFDVAGIKNLHLQLEYNQVRPYSYAHNNASQSFTHYNQPLAHPLGANFREEIVFLNYRIGNFFTEVKFNYAIIGRDSTGENFGNSVFSPDGKAYYGSNSTINEMGQGIKTTLKIIDFHIGYLVNPSTNFNIVVGISNRSSINSIENSHTNFVYFGIRTSLNNFYYDF